MYRKLPRIAKFCVKRQHMKCSEIIVFIRIKVKLPISIFAYKKKQAFCRIYVCLKSDSLN